MEKTNTITSRQCLIAIVLLLLALWVRLTDLDGFITADETKWIDRSRWFAMALLYPQQECPAVDIGREFPTQGLGCTLQIGYPGVTTMWAGTLGLLTHYWLNVRPKGIDLLTFLNEISSFTADPFLIAEVIWPGRSMILILYLEMLNLRWKNYKN